MQTSTQHSSVTADPAALREVFSQFPQPVVLIGAEVDGVPQGMIASTFTVGISLDPPLVAVAAQHTSTTWPRLRPAPRLGVSLIGGGHAHLTRQLASTKRDSRFDGVDTRVDDEGALILPGSPAWMTTRIHDQVRAGDHDLILLEVLDLGVTPGAEAVVFHRSAFKRLVTPDTPA